MLGTNTFLELSTIINEYILRLETKTGIYPLAASIGLVKFRKFIFRFPNYLRNNKFPRTRSDIFRWTAAAKNKRNPNGRFFIRMITCSNPLPFSLMNF